MTPAELVARGESKEVCGILPPSGFGSYHRRNLPELRDECGSRAELIFEPRRCRRAAGEETGEARAELIFEPRRCRRAAGEETGEARAEVIFEPRRCRRAAGEETGE